MLRELGGITVGHHEIAASQTIANYWFPRRLAMFHALYPRVVLNVSISNTREVETAVVNGAADIGFVESTMSAPQLILDEVDAGAGVTLISRYVISASIESGALSQLELDIPPRTYHMARHRKRVPSAARRAFVDMVLAGNLPKT